MTAPPPPSGVPAGWYPDPELSSTLRYWDGGQWTEHRSPISAAAGGRVTPDPKYRGSTGTSVTLFILGVLALGASGLAYLDYHSKQISYRASILADSMSLSACDVTNTERFFSGLPPIPCGPTQPSPGLAVGLLILGLILLLLSVLTRRRRVG